MSDVEDEDCGTHDLVLSGGVISLTGWRPRLHNGGQGVLAAVDIMAPTEARTADLAALVVASGAPGPFSAAIAAQWPNVFPAGRTEALRFALRRLNGL